MHHLQGGCLLIDSACRQRFDKTIVTGLTRLSFFLLYHPLYMPASLALAAADAGIAPLVAVHRMSYNFPFRTVRLLTVFLLLEAALRMRKYDDHGSKHCRHA